MADNPERVEAIHKVTEHAILGFFNSNKGNYRFLSNFHVCPVKYESVIYPSSEAAYMAAKTLDLEIRKKFLTMKPAEAKRFGQTIELRVDWEDVKVDIMREINLDKYTRNEELGKLLLDTGYKYLEESNWWKDKFWGVYYCDIAAPKGENNLGKVLMDVRAELRRYDQRRS